MHRLASAVGLLFVLVTPNIATAEGTAKKFCIIVDAQGVKVQQIDAPNDHSATYCVEQIQKLAKSNPTAAGVSLSCLTQGVPGWTDGLHDPRSQPCRLLH